MGILLSLLAANLHAERLQPETVAAFDKYVEINEQRMAMEESSGSFLSVDADGISDAERRASFDRLKRGEVIAEPVQTMRQARSSSVPGGLIHHWRGTVFIPGATLAQTISFLQDYSNQYKFYAPDVERSHLIARDGQHFRVSLRLRKKVAVLDTEYDIYYRLLGEHRALARSVSTRISEIENAGQKNEIARPVGDDNGFMWRLNSYWRFIQRDGGTYVELEAISLTRDIPIGLGWLVTPFISTIPKDSLEFTLSRTRQALIKQQTEQPAGQNE